MTGASSDLLEPTARSADGLRRLVIVAESLLIVEAIRLGFRTTAGFDLVGCADPRRTSARALMKAGPDVILMDDMEQSDRAIELLLDLRDQAGDLVVILLGLSLDAAWLERAFSAGATSVMSKATHPVALATLVREILNGHVFHLPAAMRVSAQSVSTGGVRPDPGLTSRELEILRLVASGCTNGDVARTLWVTEQTVKFHLRNVYRKLGLANRTQASRYAHVHGLVEPLVDFRPRDAAAISIAS